MIFPDSNVAPRKQPEVHGPVARQQEAADGVVRPSRATAAVEIRQLHAQPGRPGTLTD